MSTIKDLIEKIPVGERTVFDLVRDEKTGVPKLVVESRRLLPEEPRAPKRAESLSRVHTFTTAQSLARYLSRYGSSRTVVFVDVESTAIHAVLNEVAKDGFETVSMEPALHPLWAPWDAILDEPMALEAFVSHLDKHRRVIVAPDSTELRLTLSQVRATVSVEVDRGRGRNAVNGLKVTTKIEGGQTRPEAVDFPDVLTLKVPLFVQTEPVEFELDLCLEANREGGVSVLVTGGTVAEAKVRAFERMVREVEEGVPPRESEDPIVVTWGRPEHAAWSYLPEPAIK